jgi:hypothetical protein
LLNAVVSGDFTDELDDISPGFGPKVNNFDTGNGYGTRVFWTAKIPDSDFTVNLGAGTAHLNVTGLPEYDYNNFLDSDSTDWQFDQSPAHPSGFYNDTISVDVQWHGPVTETDQVKDTANGFAGTFNQDDATTVWQVTASNRPAGSAHLVTFTATPSDTAYTNTVAGGMFDGLAFTQLGTEQNGVFFPSGASLQPDAVNPSLTDLVVDGSSNGGVDIQVQSVHGGQDVRVRITGADQSYQADFPTSAITRLIVRSGPGDNHIEVSPDVHLPAILMGSFGNDHIQAGGGPTALVGGDGNDHLEGGTANDILIGGAGSDQLDSHAGSDLLIGGTTNFDNDLPALIALLNEWGRTDESYLQRVANLSNSTVNGVHPSGGRNGSTFLNGDTVQDDGAADVLNGGSGLDWFFANLTGTGVHDHIQGLQSGEIVTQIGPPTPPPP